MHIKDTNIEIIKGDITSLAVDVIVNPAGPDYQMKEGLARAIKNKGGRTVEEEALAKFAGGGKGLIVTGAGQLPAKQVIHAVSVNEDKNTDEHRVRKAYAQAVVGANSLGAASVAVPAIGCGAGGFPVAASAKIATQEIFKLLKQENVALKKIVFCLYEENVFQEFDQAMRGYMHHLKETLGPGPYVTVDIIIEMPKGIVLIERSNPPFGWALPGGFLDYGESLEEAARREAREETSLDLVDIEQFHTYSAPDRDPRFQTISTVFVARGQGEPKFGDDARGLKIVPYAELKKLDYAFDHKLILIEYLEYRNTLKRESANG